MDTSYEIIFIGAGNVASHLAPALRKAGHQIPQIYSRTLESAKQLAPQIGAEPIHQKQLISHHADMYILTLTDNGILDFITAYQFPDAILVHTSGGLGLDVFKGQVGRFGVLYPLQTFSKDKALDFQTVPVLVEGSDTTTEDLIYSLAEQISLQVQKVDSERRLKLHLAAVFACNFVNHMYDISARLVEKEGLEFDILKPLIRETAEKIMMKDPGLVQTGPAIRNDEKVIEKHLDLLSFNSIFQEVYQMISASIRARNR